MSNVKKFLTNMVYPVDTFALKPEFFPAVTKELFPMATILKHGVLPLGYKTNFKLFRKHKALNIGMVDPERGRAVVSELEKLARSHSQSNKFESIVIYRIKVADFLQVLEQVYEVSGAAVLGTGEGKVHPHVFKFLVKPKMPSRRTEPEGAR